jgi:hypothetical protein
MRLFGTGQWSPENIEAEIAFELTFARQAPSLLELVARADGNSQPVEPRPRISEAIFALSRAAELAFASGDIKAGRAICEMIVTGQGVPSTPMQLALYATVGALIGAVDVQLDAKGVRIYGQSTKPFFLPWPDDSAFTTVLSRHFFVAAAASGTLFKEPNDLFNVERGGLKAQARAALWASLEFRAIMDVASEGDQPGLSWLQAVEAMEYSYLTRLTLMQQDAYHWKTIQPRGSIIDWPLLCIWTAHLRLNEFSAELPAQNEAGLFIRELAGELWRLRKTASSLDN